MKIKPKPKTAGEWAACRCKLLCEIGINAIEGSKKPPENVSPLEYAMFNLLHAILDLSNQVSELSKGSK